MSYRAHPMDQPDAPDEWPTRVCPDCCGDTTIDCDECDSTGEVKYTAADQSADAVEAALERAGL